LAAIIAEKLTGAVEDLTFTHDATGAAHLFVFAHDLDDRRYAPAA